MVTGKPLQPVDPRVWRACAGTSVQIPDVGSRVYYFPQGHAEQAFKTPSFSKLVHPVTVCRVTAVGFSVNQETDEVFVRIRLFPVSLASDRVVGGVNEDEEVDDENENYIVSFAKILTPSDANNGGGFSVPRFCADSIFPPLDFEADPPVQNLSVRDVHGSVWGFRHIYRGTPRRHLLTTGWSKFVNSKKLVAGDSVVFMRNRQNGEISVGIRRAVRANADGNRRWNDFEEKGESEGFSRNGKGRIAAEEVEEAAELAAKGLGFEIVYCPTVGFADFVVSAEKVKRSLDVFWVVGTRVKMAIETEDSSRMTWYQGTVSSATMQDNGPWRGSPWRWRMLQVTWDEPEVLQNFKRLNPWQVEYVVPTPSLSELPPSKKCRVPQDPGFVLDGGGEPLFSMSGLNNSMMRHLSPSLMNFNSSPASIQGARQDQICVSGVSNFIYETMNQRCGDYFNGNLSPLVETVSTELNVGSSLLDNLSPDSQSSVHFFGNELVRKRVGDSSPKVGATSFQLFGKIIHLNKPVEDGLDRVGRPGTDVHEVYKDREGAADSLIGRSSTYPCMKVVDPVGVECQRA